MTWNTLFNLTVCCSKGITVDFCLFLGLFLFTWLVLFLFISLLYLSRCLWGKNYLPISWCVPFSLLLHCFGKTEIHSEREVSLNVECVSCGRQAAQRLSQCCYSHWHIWRKKKKSNQIRTVEISCPPFPLNIYSVRYDWNSNCRTFSICPSLCSTAATRIKMTHLSVMIILKANVL